LGIWGGGSRTRLWIENHPAERRLEAGKVQNLRLAAAALDGLVIPAGEVFSFWRHVGPPTARRGFVEGRMLQQGCMVASVGGGLCQLSNSLYEAALEAGCEIVERHRHSRRVPGSQAALGRDATVAWNYVDLRFRPRVAMRLGVVIDEESLWVTLSRRTPPDGPHAIEAGLEPLLPAAASCATCGRDACSLHEAG
jgi:vancomycin resistance protein YoaR